MARRFMTASERNFFENFKARLDDPQKPLFQQSDIVIMWRIIHLKDIDMDNPIEQERIASCLKNINMTRDDACLYK